MSPASIVYSTFGKLTDKFKKVLPPGKTRVLRVIDILEPTFLIGPVFKFRFWLLSSILIAIYGFQFFTFGLEFGRWWLLFTSSYTTLIVGIIFAESIRGKLCNTFNRLVDRGAVRIPAGVEGDNIRKEFEADVAPWSHRFAVVLAIALFIAFAVEYGPNFSKVQLAKTIGATLGGYIGGRILGPMVANGFFTQLIKAKGVEFLTQPEHPDGVSGLKPIGDFYFSQAILVAIPVLFLGIWAFVMMAGWAYPNWAGQYLSLFFIAIILEILAFLLPMILVHGEMKRQKNILLIDADRSTRQIESLWRQFERATHLRGRRALNDQINSRMARYHVIENMSTWPVDIRTRRRFAINNLLIVAPMAAQWATKLDIVDNFLKRTLPQVV